jgi:Flp pilus assembly secretin CpaC
MCRALYSSMLAAVLTAIIVPAQSAEKRHHKGSLHHKVLARSRVAVHKMAVAHRSAPPSISVPLDEVRVVAFSHPVATVYVGNPMVADVSVIDSRHAFVLGKAFGATNIVALDSDGKQLVNEHVTVFGHTGSTVILHRGVAQATYNCASSRCEVAPTPGDDKDSYASRMEQTVGHQDANLKAANAGR